MTAAPATELDRSLPVGSADAVALAQQVKLQADVDLMVAAAQWAEAHTVESLEEAATVPGTDRELLLAGQGAPMVSEFAVVELATAVGRTAESAKQWLGEVMEIRYRLPRIWARMTTGPTGAIGSRVEPWRAVRIARATQMLDAFAAAWVDTQLAPIAHKCGIRKIDQLVTDAVRRFDPDLAYEDEVAQTERRDVLIETDHVIGGCVQVYATLDEADARDLAAAIAKVSRELLLTLGRPASPRVLRALALGEMARRELGRGFEVSRLAALAPQPPAPSTTGAGRRDATLYVHIDADALDQVPGEPAIARVEQGSTSYTISVDRIREWLTVHGSHVTIRPVIDMPGTASVTGYEATDRLREHVILRRSTCAFPYCSRSARRADLDHITPYDLGGPPGQTDTENLAPCCRLHHRAKTHGGWTYTQLAPGEYLWRGPHGQLFHVDHDGTTTL